MNKSKEQGKCRVKVEATHLAQSSLARERDIYAGYLGTKGKRYGGGTIDTRWRLLLHLKKEIHTTLHRIIKDVRENENDVLII